MPNSLSLRLERLLSRLRSHKLVSQEQERGLWVLVALLLASGGLLFTISRGSESVKPIPVAPVSLISKPAVTKPLVIDVEGKVAHPGVYSLPAGSRAIDAVKAAGNILAGVDASDINLAHLLIDGEEILVGAPRATSPSSGRARAKLATKSAGAISINSANQAQFESLPGIGPVLAARIITYRSKNGPFLSIDGLRKVSGLGASKFSEIKSLIHL